MKTNTEVNQSELPVPELYPSLYHPPPLREKLVLLDITDLVSSDPHSGQGTTVLRLYLACIVKIFSNSVPHFSHVYEYKGI